MIRSMKIYFTKPDQPTPKPSTKSTTTELKLVNQFGRLESSKNYEMQTKMRFYKAQGGRRAITHRRRGNLS